MDMSELKKVFDEQGNLWAEYRKANDERLAAMATGKAVSDLDAKLAAMEARLVEIDGIKSTITQMGDRVDMALKRALRPGMHPGDAGDVAGEVKTFNELRSSMARPVSSNDIGRPVDESAYVAYKGAFLKWARLGREHLNTDEVKAMQAGIDADGGYLLPPPVIGRIVQRLYELSPFRQLAAQITISAPDIEGLEDLDETGGVVWTGETTAPTETATPKIGKWKIEAHEMAVEPKLTQRILDDAAINVEQWLADKIANKIARVEADVFINGNGVAKPRGLATYTTAATGDASRAWGTFEHVSTGVNSGFAASSPADILFDLVGAFKPFYLNGASFMTRREVITLIRKFKDSQLGYLWQPGLQAGQADRLIGYPVVMNQDMPALAAASLSVALGNYAETYLIVDRQGARTLRDPYTDKPFVKFWTTKRVGGGAVNYEAVKFIRFGT
jgi:HK97 family phage major capsid protein